LEAIQVLYESDVESETAATLAVFRAEESERFNKHTIGSRFALGLLDEDVLGAKDSGRDSESDRISLGTAMEAMGFQPPSPSVPTLDYETAVRNFVEVHIEQGRVLDEDNDEIGLVTSIRSPVRYWITVKGEYDHSGATKMKHRHDALAGASEMVVKARDIGRQKAENGDIVVTVGEFTVEKGAINKVCGKAKFKLDIRSDDEQYRNEVEEDILQAFRDIGEREELEVELDKRDDGTPTELSEDVLKRLQRATEATGASYQLLPSGGGHDAMNFQTVGVPTGMVFVPSVNGTSHSPDEETNPESLPLAAETLVRFINNT
jgi:hydantoinase/carbamoylase family amidase